MRRFALPLVILGPLWAGPLGGRCQNGPSTPPPPITVKIVRVVDGDTVVIRRDGKNVTTRIIGIDSPESVDPRKPVERFGREASKHLRELAGGREVTLEFEPGSKSDRYGRQLAYLRLGNGQDVGRTMIRDGFALAYPKYPHARLDDYRIAEREARKARAGLWGDDPTPEKPTPATVVYVTKSGTRYHSEGCRFLENSGSALPLAEARKGRTACKVCKPPSLYPR